MDWRSIALRVLITGIVYPKVNIWTEAHTLKSHMNAKLEPSLSSDPKELLEAGIYVDKTSYMLKMLTDGYNKHFFLIRPPKFGKTTFLQTLQLILEGEHNKNLFKDMFIYNSSYNWKKLKVLYLDFATITGDDLHTFDRAFYQKFNLNVSSFYEREHFLDKDHGVDIAVLVDNYDSPIVEALENMDRPGLAKIIAEGIRNFMAKIVDDEKSHIKFTLVTGTNQFREILPHYLRMFSDISMKPEFAAIVGFTNSELDAYLQHFIAKNDSMYTSLRKNLFHYYYGYAFSDEKSTQKVYNPYSVICCLRQNGTLDNYWFMSGQSKYLNRRILNHENGPSTRDACERYELEINSMEYEDPGKIELRKEKLKSLMYYGGYYTLFHSYVSPRKFVRMRIPTREVANAIIHHLPTMKAKFMNEFDFFVEIYDFLSNLDAENVKQNMKGFVRYLNDEQICDAYHDLSDTLVHAGLDVISQETEITEIKTYDTIVILKELQNHSIESLPIKLQEIWSSHSRNDSMKTLGMILNLVKVKESSSPNFFVRDYAWEYRSEDLERTLAAGSEHGLVMHAEKKSADH